MTKRIKLSAGDYVLLSDIPNEQVFNLVKKCFTNAGFNDCDGKYAQWNKRGHWPFIKLATNEILYSYQCAVDLKRQLSLSDVFNSVNGGFNWYGLNYIHILSDDYSISPFELLEDNGLTVLFTIKRITDSTEAIIQPEAPQWWDYEKGWAVGLPPVDTECEYSLNSGGFWYKCRVISQYKLVLHCPHLENDDWNGLQVIGENEKIMFRPLDYKTPKQIAVDKAFACLSEFNSAEQVLGELYDMGMLQVAE